MEKIPTISTHMEYLKEIFKIEGKIDTILEFGMGDYSTGLLIENASSVISIEMQNKEWFDKIYNTFSNKPNWQGKLALGPYAYKNISLPKKIDLAFVDGHGDSRPDCINDMMDLNCEIIVAHDTQQPLYKWTRIKNNTNYKQKTFKKHSVWTTLWTTNISLYENIKNKD